MQSAHLAGGVLVEGGVVSDELDGGVPDVLARQLTRALYQLQHRVHVPATAAGSDS